ncbi:MAG: heparinase II/III-family protein, partial [Acidobacteria bacterium]|nr:heparinase II/III-family protein [Acidobacteriota bacterium]
LVGDADDGRLVQLAGYGTSHPADHRHLLATGAVLFNRRDFRQAAGAAWEEAWWLVGTPPPPAVFGGPTPGSRAFPAGGFFILRTPDIYVLIRCGDVGREGIGGHAHCDQLSFELAVGRQPLVIDPGSYVYTADLGVRHRFRSTSSHNTVRVAGAEQNRIRVEDCFQMPDDTHARVRHWRSEPEVDEFEGEHLGYRRLPARVVHRRAMTLDKAESALYLADHLAGRGRVRLEWFFHLAPGVTVVRPAEARPRALARLEEFKPERSALASAYSLIGGNRAVTLWVFSPLPLGDEVTEGWVSPRYGVCEQGSVVSFAAEAELPLSLLFVFDLAPG